MKPEEQSILLLGVTRSRAKMFEYSIPSEHHINIARDPAKLLSLTIGLLGNYASNKEKKLEELKNLLFSAQYFDSYTESRLNSSINEYLFLIGSASYYLCDLPGSSSVLASRLGQDCPSLDCDGLEDLLFSLLTGKTITKNTIKSENYKEYIDFILYHLGEYYKTGNNLKEIKNKTEDLCLLAYEIGTPRQLLMSDVIKVVLQKRIENSSWQCLKKYTDTNIDIWRTIITKQNFIKEFWPAQKLLGEKEIYKGKSAIVQMPTSAGKTKSIEIIIRSSFLSERSNLAIIVAPFRALCSEIKNSLSEAFIGEKIDIDSPSDTFQVDFESIDNITNKLVLVVTPEKLMYMLRHSPELAEKVGLIIYDEGHQFDNGLRGVTYELLISSLKRLIPKNVQTVLISAVISNAEDIGKWLNGEGGEVIYGTNLLPTYRTVAFTSWQGSLGSLEFVDQINPEKREYFVPRVIEQSELSKKNKETIIRVFPDKLNGKSIALYLGIKLARNGCVAIFCGAKTTVMSLCENIIDLHNRNYQATFPLEYSNLSEIKKLTHLHSQHFGPEYVATKSATLGVFAHSSNTPQGIRLAIEYASQKNLIKFIICTSTLAQGVNLPIKYLIVTSVYQGKDEIKTRDFHNLIGRAGRSGMHTEGSILFADSEVYDKRRSRYDGWRWDHVKELLDPKNSEPCVSTLLSIFDPIYSDTGNAFVKFDLLEFLKNYLKDDESLRKILEKYYRFSSNTHFTRDGISWQISKKLSILYSIESYLMAYWNESELKIAEDEITNLAKGTLAYYLSDDKRKEEIIQLFLLLADHVNANFQNSKKRKAYGKTLFGIKDLIEIEHWVLSNMDKLLGSSNNNALLVKLWPIIKTKVSNKNLRRIEPEDSILKLCLNWISGMSYHELFTQFLTLNPKIVTEKQKRQPKQETIIELCDNAFAYDATLIIAAVREVIGFLNSKENDALIQELNTLQKRIKYGLSNSLAISFYELGFSDRVIASELAQAFSTFSDIRSNLIQDIKANTNRVTKIIDKYPEYYSNTLKEINLR